MFLVSSKEKKKVFKEERKKVTSIFAWNRHSSEGIKCEQDAKE